MEIIKRTGYTLRQAIHYYQQLVPYTQDQNTWRCAQLTALDPQHLQQQKINIIVLDFDGVMANHGEPEPLPEAVSWLQRCLQIYAPEQLYILSNKPSLVRQHYFQRHFPGVTFVISPHKKPYPDGLLQVIAHAKQPPEAVVLVDDRLLTGVLAAQIAHTQAVYITKPYANFAKRPMVESFFALLRALEHLLIS